MLKKGNVKKGEFKKWGNNQSFWKKRGTHIIFKKSLKKLVVFETKDS